MKCNKYYPWNYTALPNLPSETEINVFGQFFSFFYFRWNNYGTAHLCVTLCHWSNADDSIKFSISGFVSISRNILSLKFTNCAIDTYSYTLNTTCKVYSGCHDSFTMETKMLTAGPICMLQFVACDVVRCLPRIASVIWFTWWWCLIQNPKFRPVFCISVFFEKRNYGMDFL